MKRYFKSPEEERIYLLEEKIETLQNLLLVRDSEIRLYRETLEEIGAKLTNASQSAMRYDDPLTPIAVEMTNIYYNKNIAVPIESERNLRMIDFALNTRIKKSRC